MRLHITGCDCVQPRQRHCNGCDSGADGDACPNLIGFKDGVGDLELMMKIYLRLGDRLTYIGGLPTAETFALSYLEMGVTTYSSAIFNFLPRWATEFYAAVRRRDHAYVAKEMREFVLPYLRFVIDAGAMQFLL